MMNSTASPDWRYVTLKKAELSWRRAVYDAERAIVRSVRDLILVPQLQTLRRDLLAKEGALQSAIRALEEYTGRE